jgi:hypothetical protein
MTAEFQLQGARAQSASAATLTPAKPTVNGVGGRLLAVLQTKNNAVHATATAGWSRIGAQINSGAAFTASLWEAPETSAAPVFTWTGAVACAAQVIYYMDPNNPLAAIVAGTNNNGTTNPHSTASFNSTLANSLIVYVDVAAANTALATPAGWVEDIDAGSATDAGRTTFGSKALAASGSASGAISVNGAVAAWVQWQVEVKESVSATGLQVSKEEAETWLDVKDGFAASKMEAITRLNVKDGLIISKVETITWLDRLALDISKMEAIARLDAKAGLDICKIEVITWLDGPSSAVTTTRKRAAQIIG